MKNEIVCQVSAPYGMCAGLVFVGSLCVAAAPILKWAKGKQRPYLENYFKRKGWTFTAQEDDHERRPDPNDDR